MTAAPHFTEAERLSLLAATRLLDADPPPALDALVRMAARLTGCLMAAVNLVDAHRLFALARHNLPQRHFSREGSMCDATLLHPQGLVVQDIHTDERFHLGSAQDGESPLRFYAGMPLMVEGMPLGTICVIDVCNRDWTPDLQSVLADLALTASTLIAAQLAASRFRKQEARIRTASLAGSDWLWETDSQGRIQWVSSSLLQHTGLDPVAEIGLSARDIYTPRNDDTRASWDRYMAARHRREPFIDAVADRVTPRGRIAVSISGTPVFNQQGQFMGYRGASRNVTRQLELEHRVRHHDLLLRQAFDTFQAGVMISDPQGRIVLANRHWRSRTGVHVLEDAPSWPELVRQMIQEGRYPEAIGREEEFFRWRMEVVDQDQPVTLRVNDALFQCRDQRLPDGSVVHFSTRLPDGGDQAATGAAQDSQVRQVTAEKLRASEERWKFALEGAGDGVWDWQVGYPQVFYSPRWKSMLGHDEAEVSDRAEEWFDRIHPRERDRIVQAFTRYCEEGQGIFQAEFRMLHQQGHYVWILCRGTVVRRDDLGQPMRVVGTHSDITRLKQAERVLREKQTAEAASRAKSEFLSRMSHEIRTPLNAVRGFAQLLDQRLDKHTPGDLSDYVRQILASSELLSDLVNDVLDLQQIEAGAMPVHRDLVPLGDVVSQCISMMTPLASQNQIELIAPAAGTWHVWSDRRRLQQVLCNLVSNAIKYNRPHGSVELDVAAQPDSSLTVGIKDTGMGMSPDQLARLFQPFERLGRDTSPIEGSGLGLIITRSLLESMGGRLEIRSQPGVGTTVSITLPEAPAPSAPAIIGLDRATPAAIEASGREPCPALPSQADHCHGGPSASDPSPASQLATTTQGGTPLRAEDDPLRVMYVEDNRINALLFEEALRPYPELLLEVAEDGQAALTVAREHRPEVLVIDAHLPGMTGFEVLRALRTLPGLGDVPAYMCSADALPEDIAKAQREGFVGYWTKPIDIVQVTTELCRLAQGHNVAP
ncbi:MAG: PAS domain S-box protein [Rubrivivax sp.]|nr:MAG: PAS domain S-box protein [Rubrivivax sp.]